MTIQHIAGYAFCQLGELYSFKHDLKAFCDSHGIKGTILLTPEGINMSLAGSLTAIDFFLNHYQSSSWLKEMILHKTPAYEIPFNRMLVKIKKEIIPFPFAVDPATKKAPYISPQELMKLYEDNKDFLLLDTRNDYEVRLGTFKGARHLDIKTFTAFKEQVDILLKTHKDFPIVTVCTGGVRCEKAALYMEQSGFSNVKQLHGGFLAYFKECRNAFYEGDCFVFDKRVALTPNLEPSKDMALCYACRNPLTKKDQQSSDYQEGVSCSYCLKKPKV